MSASRLVFTFARAGFKAAASKLRGAGALAEYQDWPVRAAVCERCPLRVVQCGVSYCGKPFLQLPDRDPAADGCGCPTRAKAKDPAEHCPLTPRHLAVVAADGVCDCKWCLATAAAAGAKIAATAA